jgi:hypothetical protein
VPSLIGAAMKQPANLLAISMARWSITFGLLVTRLVLACFLFSLVWAWRIWDAFAHLHLPEPLAALGAVLSLARISALLRRALQELW